MEGNTNFNLVAPSEDITIAKAAIAIPSDSSTSGLLSAKIPAGIPASIIIPQGKSAFFDVSNVIVP
jgi:hypothetical protein